MKPGLLLILSLIVLTSSFDTLSQLILKSTINRLKVSLSFNLLKIAQFVLRVIATPRVWLGFLFSTLSLCVWLLVLSRVELNFAFSVDSMHYIFIALAARFFLKEKVGLKRWVGTLFIVLGIALVSLS